MQRIITITNLSLGQFFFTTDHCQNHGLGPDWVPCTATLPMHVVPRPCVPDGIVRTKEDYVNVFRSDTIEIPNPNPTFYPESTLKVFNDPEFKEDVQRDWDEYEER
jgi:hypothetical protein